MIETEDDIVHPPNSPVARILLQLKESGEPILLSINGKAEVTIKDDASLEKLLDLLEFVDCVEAIREGMAFFDNGGKGISLEEAKAEIRRKHGVSL